MKRIAFFSALAIAMLTIVSCGSAKQASTKPESARNNVTGLEGNTVVEATIKTSGFENADALSDDGTEIIKRPYKWYLGIGEASDQQMAIEIAQREAYATISRIMNNAVQDEAERGKVDTNKQVQEALTSHWSQFSQSLLKACEPFGDAAVQYNPSTRLYKAYAKVAVRGDYFNQMLKTAAEFKPANLKGEELEDFIATNKAIMEAARGK